MPGLQDPPAALELSRVTKRYGRVVALEDVNLLVRPGTVHAVLGENGAGKTTLMHIAYGMVRPDAGRMFVSGREVKIASPLAAIAQGLGMVHQHFTLVPSMTVAENLALGGTGLRNSRAMTMRVREITERIGFHLDPQARVAALPVSAQQRVEIAKALAREATILILDEPTAVLAPPEIDDLLRWLRSFVNRGHAAVLITHRLREALAVADDVTVLRRGRIVRTGLVSATSAAQLTAAMIGSAVTQETPPKRPALPGNARVTLDVRNVTLVDRDGRVRIDDATFAVRAGELVGVIAVEGSGQQELLRALAGRHPVAKGTLRRPAAVGFVPEDRARDAVLLDRSLAENVALRGAGARRGLLSWSAVRTHTLELLHAYDVRAGDPQVSVGALSGGNQQKLVLARELGAAWDQPAPSALVVENPTRGLDVGAMAAVHRRLNDACVRGAAIIVYSSDLDEVLALAARVLVVCAGRVREVPLNRAAIGRAMLGYGDELA